MAKIPLNLETDIQPVSDFRSNAAAILKQVRESGRPLILTQRGRAAAVLLDIGLYQALIDEIETLRDVNVAREDLAAGRVLRNEEARARLHARCR
jgi:prevent-host-death family protein